jgi:hypothetical protein
MAHGTRNAAFCNVPAHYSQEKIGARLPGAKDADGAGGRQVREKIAATSHELHGHLVRIV